jgi:hypothetical protein
MVARRSPGVEDTMKRTYSKLAAQPEHGQQRPKPPVKTMTTADRVRASLLASPPRRG